MRLLATALAVFLAITTTRCSVLRETEESEPIVEDVDTDYQEVQAVNLTDASLRIQTPNEENEEKKTYDGFQLWNVHADTNDKVKLISTLKQDSDVHTWGGNRTNIDILVQPGRLDEVQSKLRTNLIDFEVVIPDMQKAINEENPHVEEEADRFGYPSFTSYNRLADIHQYLDTVAQTYPSTCKVEVIGSSVQGRPIKLLKISNGKPGNKAVWVDGGVHAREWITPASVTYIIKHLVDNLDTESPALQNLDFYILPVANPDGYEYSHNNDRLWRKNRARSGQCSGTDLNRNFGYRWGGKGSGKNPCQETYGGSGPFSEPETAAIKNFITRTPTNWKAYISYHSYGQYILYPWGYDRVVPVDYKDLERVAQKAANAISQVSGGHYTHGPSGSTLYPASGGSDDWAKGVVGMKYTYTIELRDQGRYGFVLPSSYIIPTAKEALAAFKVIAEAAYAA